MNLPIPAVQQHILQLSDPFLAPFYQKKKRNLDLCRAQIEGFKESSENE